VKKSSQVADMQNSPPPDPLQRVNHLLNVLEQLYKDMDRQQKAHHQHFEKLKSETLKAIEEGRLHLKLLLRIDTTESSLSFELPIKDEKLKKAWEALFRHPEGETADTIAGELNRHRTTVSTYLNMLVTLEYAEKFRKGHEIFYKAIIKTEKEENIR
jgi:predicted transcriptional regulator